MNSARRSRHIGFVPEILELTTQIGLLYTKAAAKKAGVEVTIVLDFVHILEYWQFHKRQEFQRNHVHKFQDPKRLLAA